MAPFARRLLRLARSDDRGAIGVLVAVLMAGGVLIGMGALVVDVGQIYQERAELQNGADAAAIGVAKSCALGACAPDVAAGYADANASKLTGGAAAADQVCGSGNLGACPPGSGAPTDCPPPPTGADYVDVSTSTKTASGSTLLPPAFARTLLGNSGYQGSNVAACAQAEWGAPAAATTVALTISACAWDQATQQGTAFPPNPAPSPAADQVLTLNTGPGGTGCATEPVGADGPGFAWVAHPRGNCTVPLSGPGFQGRPQTSVSFSCELILESAQQNQSPILIPIYVASSGGPGNPSYTLEGFADFVVTGYHLFDSGGFDVDASDWLNPGNNCHGASSCLNGYFVQGVIPFTGSLGGTNLGVSVINLTG
jgi:hypothetical protein